MATTTKDTNKNIKNRIQPSIDCLSEEFFERQHDLNTRHILRGKENTQTNSFWRDYKSKKTQPLKWRQFQYKKQTPFFDGIKVILVHAMANLH